MTHRVALIAFDGFQLLDLSGPASVYGAANDALGKAAYEVIVTAAAVPTVRSGCGIEVASIQPETIAHVDSLFIMGGTRRGSRHSSPTM